MSTVLIVHQSTFITLYVATPDMRADPRNTKHHSILYPSLTQNKCGIAALISENEFILCCARAQKQDNVLRTTPDVAQEFEWPPHVSGPPSEVVYRGISCQTCISRSWMVYDARCSWQMHQYVMSQRSFIGFRSAECL